MKLVFSEPLHVLNCITTSLAGKPELEMMCCHRRELLADLIK